MSRKICKCDDYEDLGHYVIEQFTQNNKAEGLVERNHNNEAIAFISIMLRNSYHSSSSPYHKLYRQSNKVFNDRKIPDEVEEDYDLQKDFDIEMIEGILEEMELDREGDWYRAKLFKLWIETGNVSEIHRITSIPRQSISNAIKEAKEIIIEEVKKRKKL